jgi:hypothetical protein
MTKEEQKEFRRVLMNEATTPVAKYRASVCADRLRFMAERYRKIQARWMNDPPKSAAEEARWEREESAFEEEICLLAQDCGMGVIFRSDPRGPCVLLTLPSGKTNDMEGEGWIVPV